MIYCGEAKPTDCFVAEECGCLWLIRNGNREFGERVWGCAPVPPDEPIGAKGQVVAVYLNAECPPIPWQ